MQSSDIPPTAKNSQQPINVPTHISTEGLDEKLPEQELESD